MIFDEKKYELMQMVEQLRVQLAGCGVAALGYIEEPNLAKSGDYGWSQSYQDVVSLRLKYESLKEENERLKAKIESLSWDGIDMRHFK